MLKYAKIIDQDAKRCSVGLGNNIEFYKSLGMIEQDVELAYDGNWYITGYAPEKPKESYIEQRLSEYPSLGDMIDAFCKARAGDDSELINLMGLRQAIKEKYPKF